MISRVSLHFSYASEREPRILKPKCNNLTMHAACENSRRAQWPHASFKLASVMRFPVCARLASRSHPACRCTTFVRCMIRVARGRYQVAPPTKTKEQCASQSQFILATCLYTLTVLRYYRPSTTSGLNLSIPRVAHWSKISVALQKSKAQ